MTNAHVLFFSHDDIPPVRASRGGRVVIPPEVVALLGPRSAEGGADGDSGTEGVRVGPPGAWEQAFPFLTVSETGHPHVCLLSRAQLAASADGRSLFVSLHSSGAVSNLHRHQGATLVAVAGQAAYSIRVRPVRALVLAGRAGFELEVLGCRPDSTGVSLSPLQFEPSRALARAERWEKDAAVLQVLRAPSADV